MNRASPQAVLADLQARVSELLRKSPAADVERNVRALLGQTFQRFDLITREEFEANLERLDRLQQRIEQLESRLAADGGSGSAEHTRPQGTAWPDDPAVDPPPFVPPGR